VVKKGFQKILSIYIEIRVKDKLNGKHKFPDYLKFWILINGGAVFFNDVPK